MKKIITSISTLGMIFVPTTLLIACSSLLGSNGVYDSVDDNKIVIQTTWSASGTAIDALNETVHKYNETQKSASGFIPVVVEHVEGGYGTIPSQAITKIQSHDTRTLPNLYIDYPSAVGQIAPYEMALDMGDELKREWFIDEFVKVNDKIAGVKPGHLFSVPLSKSTEAIVVNKPLMNYIFNSLKSKGAKIVDPKGSIVDEIMTFNNLSDLSAIKKQWGGIKSSVTNEANKIVINDNIFKTYDGLFKFVTMTQPLFDSTQKPNLLGLDSPSNTMYGLSTLLTNNKEKDFLFTKNDKTGYVDFNFLEKGKKQTQIFKDSYSYIQKAINANAIWIGGGGAYGSTRLQKHKMAISISSSAGLQKAYSTKYRSSDLNKNETLFLAPINKLHNYGTSKVIDVNGQKIDLNKVSATIAQGPSFNSIHINSREDNGAKAFLKWFYKANDSKSKMNDENGNKLTPSDFFAQKSSYIVPLKGSLDKNSTIGKKVSGVDYKKINGNLLGVKASFEAINRELKAVKDHPGISGIIDLPVDNMTGSIRKVIDSNILASNNSKNNGASSYSPETLWGNVRRQAIIDQIISDDGTLTTKFIYPNMKDRNFSDINWNKFSYIDAEIKSWIDGDTPKVIVVGTSGADAVKSIKIGDSLSIRIQGIDTPEAHVKMGELKYKDHDGKMVGFTDAQMGKTIKKYQDQNRPLAVYSHGHYNTLSIDKKGKYAKYHYWKNIYVDIQTKDDGSAYDPIAKDSKIHYKNDKNKTGPIQHPIYDMRNIMVELANGEKTKLITNEAKREGYWGLKSSEFARQQMPAGTKVRIATDGRKSYNRVVGSIFYGPNASKNWSVEILKKGLTLPFLSNPAAVLDETSILYHNGLAIADAFNYALDNKIGLFNPKNNKTLQEHLKNTLVIHGATDFAPLIHYGSNKPIGLPTDIYQYIQTRKDNRNLYRDPSERID